MKDPLKIVIFDGSFKTTAFINRLIAGLSHHHQVFVFGFDEQLARRIPNVTYVALGSASKTWRLFFISLHFAFTILFKKGAIDTFFRYLGLLIRLKKQPLQQLNLLTAVRLYQPAIFHVQWPSLLPWCEPLLANKAVKVVLSQRGYQNNVRPFVNAENLKYLQKVYPLIDGFHSVSKDMVRVSTKIYSNPKKIDSVVYSGFNFEVLPFTKEVSSNKTLQIITIGRPHWKKGYTDALKAMKLLQEKGVSFHYKIIGGDGNEELEYLLSDYKLGTSVTIMPKVTQEDVYQLMRDSAMFLSPSLEEGLPNVVIEAMAIGLPVIATDCGGVAELIDSTTGILIPTRNPNAMATAIIKFAETPLEVLNSQRLEARKRVETRHSVEQMVLGMEGFYAEVLGVD